MSPQRRHRLPVSLLGALPELAPVWRVPPTAAELAADLAALRAERAFAALRGLDGHGEYAAQLRRELRAAAAAYAGAVVTEQAVERAAVLGRLQG